MISVSDAARFAEESISTKKFKGWWETILDNVILGLLLLTLFSWAKVISVEASGFLCIPIDPKVGYSFNLAKYFNTRCVQSFEQKLLLYYPYFIFVLWLLLFLVQRTWMKIPFVRCRLDSFHKLFTEMIKVSSKMKYRSINKTIAKREMNEIDQISTSNCNEQLLEVAITEMRQHILMILDRQSLLLQCYITKNTIMLLIAACSSSFLVYWISTLDLFQANFHCHLDASETFTPLHNFTCNFPSAPFLYVIIFISIGLQNLIMFFSLYALYWMFSKRTKKNILKCGLVLTKARGFSDLKYCLELFRCTFQEREKIIESLSQQYCRPEQTLVLGRNDDFMILKYITDYLGLYINTGKNGDSSLNRCIEELKEQIKGKTIIVLLFPGMGNVDKKNISFINYYNVAMLQLLFK